MRKADAFAGFVLRAGAAEQLEDPLVVLRRDAAAVVGEFDDGAGPADIARDDGDAQRPARKYYKVTATGGRALEDAQKKFPLLAGMRAAMERPR